MSDTPQLPSKRLKSEDVAASPSSQHMSHGTSYLTPSHFSHAYAPSYTPAPPPPPQFHYGQQTYVGQPLSLVPSDHQQQQQQHQQQHQQQQQHHYQTLSHPLTSYHASQLPGGHSRKRPATELDTPPMAQPVGIPSLPSYSMPSTSGMLSGHGHSGMHGGGLGISGSSDVGMHLGPGAVQDIGSSSGPKKGRTNTPWTREEEMRLKAMRDAGNSWSDIAKEFPNRTEGSVKKHWYKDMHYTEISEDEGSFVGSFPNASLVPTVPLTFPQQKAALISAIKEYDANKWKIIGQKMGKPAKACEQFAREHLGKT